MLGLFFKSIYFPDKLTAYDFNLVLISPDD